MKKYYLLIIIIICIVLTNSIKIEAGSITGPEEEISILSGESKSVYITGNGVAGTVSIDSSDYSVADASIANKTESWIDNDTLEISVRAFHSGNAQIIITFNVTDYDNPDECYIDSFFIDICVLESETPYTEVTDYSEVSENITDAIIESVAESQVNDYPENGTEPDKTSTKDMLIDYDSYSYIIESETVTESYQETLIDSNITDNNNSVFIFIMIFVIIILLIVITIVYYYRKRNNSK